MKTGAITVYVDDIKTLDEQVNMRMLEMNKSDTIGTEPVNRDLFMKLRKDLLHEAITSYFSEKNQIILK